VSPRWFASVGLWLSLATAACSSDPAAPDASSGGSASAGTTGAGAGASGGSAGKPSSSNQSCPEGDNPKSDVAPVQIGVVTGHIVDENGEPTTAGLVQICGTDICRNANVSESGKFADAVDGPINAPACKFGDGFTWAKLALPLAEGDTDLGTLVTVRLPDYADGVPLVAGQTVTSGGVSLTLAEDARVQANKIDYETDAERVLRAAPLPAAALAQLDPEFVAGFALSPLETRICPNPALSLENDAALEAGTELELYLLGLDATEEFVPYGRWQKVADGQVSDDGAALEFPDGVPLLTAVAVKVKP